MSATTTTPQHHHQHRVPLAATLAVAGVIAAAGVVGVAWQQSDGDSAAPAAQAPAQAQALTPRTPTLRDYLRYHYYHGQNAPDAQHRTTFRGGGQVQMGQ
jgi:hypothetical protein